MSAKTRRLLREIDERLDKALELIQQSGKAVDPEVKKQLRCEACLLMEQNVVPLDRLQGPEAERRKDQQHYLGILGQPGVIEDIQDLAKAGYPEPILQRLVDGIVEQAEREVAELMDALESGDTERARELVAAGRRKLLMPACTEHWPLPSN